MEPIQICKKDLSKDLFENILFFMFAEGGAMGEMGAVNFIKNDGKLYHLNYLWGDVKFEEVLELFPTLAKCDFGNFGLDSKIPDGWTYVNLGAGNHLIIKNEIYPKFYELIKDYKYMGEIYQNWIEHANTILN